MAGALGLEPRVAGLEAAVLASWHYTPKMDACLRIELSSLGLQSNFIPDKQAKMEGTPGNDPGTAVSKTAELPITPHPYKINYI